MSSQKNLLAQHPPLDAPQVLMLGPHQPETCGSSADLLLDITDAFDTKRRAMECMGAPSHLVDHHTDLAVRRGVQAVRNGGVRDVADLTELRFPVRSKAVRSQGTNKLKPGSVNVPVQLPDLMVNPGDAIAAETADKAQARADNEPEKRAQSATGVLGLDLYDLRPKVEELGTTDVDAEED